MKNTIILFIIFSFFNFANAQFTFGIKAGLNFPFLADKTSTQSLTRLHVGGFANYEISNKFSIQPELHYKGYGGKEKPFYEIQVNNYYQKIEGTEIIKLDYIALPLLGKITFGKRFYATFGPQVAVAISQKYEAEYFIDNNGEKSTERRKGKLEDLYEDNGGKVNSVDFALNFGFGFQIKNKIQLYTEYNLGLNPVVKYQRTTLKNRNIMLGVGYVFQ